MRYGTLVAAVAALIALSPTAVAAIAAPGGSTTPGNGGGEASISTWVIGAVNGGVSKPAGATSCTPWAFVDGSNLAGIGLVSATVINPATGLMSQVFFRICNGTYQFVYVGPLTPTDVARVAYQKATALVGKPDVAFSPPIDKMIVNFETWLGVTPRQPVTATATIPGLSATVTAEPTNIEWATGSRVAGDSTNISCQPWGSTTSAAGGCAWTPAYPSVAKVTGTTDLHYHGSVTIVWKVSWQATNGATGTLADLRTTTPIKMGVQEIQTIGG